MGVNCLLFASCAVCFFASAMALQCFQCGLYNDGVGSITPCINHTYMHLKECPTPEHLYCIKYISEGSTVRDCVPKCTEREDWGAKTYCCTEDGCNSSRVTQSSLIFTFFAIMYVMAH